MTEKYFLSCNRANFVAIYEYILCNVSLQLFARVPKFIYVYLFHLSISYYNYYGYASIAIAIMKISSYSSKSCSYRERFFIFFISRELLRNHKTTRLNAFDVGNLFLFFYVYTKEARRAHPAPTLNAIVVS